MTFEEFEREMQKKQEVKPSAGSYPPAPKQLPTCCQSTTQTREQQRQEAYMYGVFGDYADYTGE